MLRKQKAVQIPVQLFNEICEYMEYQNEKNWPDLDPVLQDMHTAIMEGLDKKRDAAHLRNLYGDIVIAKDDDSRVDARIRYLAAKPLYKP